MSLTAEDRAFAQSLINKIVLGLFATFVIGMVVGVGITFFSLPASCLTP